MDQTPERPSHSETVTFSIPEDAVRSPRRSSRIKKNPSVTPRRFNKFFTPRARNLQRAVRSSRKALHDLSAATLNSRADSVHRPSKRRRISFSSVPSLPSSPIRKGPASVVTNANVEFQGLGPAPEAFAECFTTDDDYEDEDIPGTTRALPPPLIPYRAISTSAAALSRRLGVRNRVVEANGSNLWQHETANFYSSADDFYSYNRQVASLPFCATGFKTVSLVAVGDEDGTVRVHDACSQDQSYNQVFLQMHPHDNAVMDLELSEDDALLATASGDQTCRIIDMKQQVSTHTLVGHTGSIKRVQFQPGSGNNLLASCSRDGSICLWDLRCAKAKGSTMFQELRRESATFLESSREVNTINDIRDAHTARNNLSSKGRRQHIPISARSDFAVTTCAFISASRPHLLASASENDAVIKLWDMRTSYKQRSGGPNPISATLEPQSHQNHRQFGVTSIAMSTDGSRLYSLCRDHTIYAYSTAHLVLGSAPEMALSSSALRPARQPRQPVHGLGPLYGFRHPSLRLQTFYDKLALRHMSNDHTEVLASGSSEECAVLFPTDERYLNKAARRQPENATLAPRLRRATSSSSSSDAPLPIYYHGTALVNAHRKEVTAVAWTRNGNLVTTADDYTTRCWREDAAQARMLRLNSERDVRRYQSGWAEVPARYDEDDDEF
ncbi:hypothetical protein PV08_01565 [Exophiala spinifera]|uniref:Anaphase-promoting complex subunit 4 WD40 domain-containing protein n=1 Tax=Exophiala spinifera TaxID=91928 RepID=A0A0D1Z0A5_9EURO|nr:uncharacterized protein PV08_01565 [Exophiala spinifera]KIW20986.1 hypothetical protein PV08_01565 [Exophiala spinifera]